MILSVSSYPEQNGRANAQKAERGEAATKRWGLSIRLIAGAHLGHRAVKLLLPPKGTPRLPTNTSRGAEILTADFADFTDNKG